MKNLKNLNTLVREDIYCKVRISTPTIRSDDGKAILVTKLLLEVNVVDNCIIDKKVACKRFHFNTTGTSLANIF